MKKIITFLLVAILIFSFVACTDDSHNSADQGESLKTVTATQKSTAKPNTTAKPKKTPVQTNKIITTQKPTATPTQKPHTHSFGSWSTTKQPTCATEGIKTRVCSCGLKDTQALEKVDHNYVDGFCSFCKKYDPNKKAEEIRKENERYELEIAEFQALIDVKTDYINDLMYDSGFSYIYSMSECRRAISQLESELEDLHVQYIYATFQSDRIQIQREIDYVNEELVRYGVMENIIEEKEELDELYEYIELVEIEHRENLNKINKKYS